MKKIFLIFTCIFLSIGLYACGEQELAQGETYEDSPLAANRKALEQEKAELAGSETKAEHNYDASKLVEKESDTLVIGEKLFLTQINDIYNNYDRYEDKTVVVEGMLGNYTEWDDSFQNAVIYRNGPGCCGNDGWGGFYLSDMETKDKDGKVIYSYKGEEDIELNDWIKATGKPELYEGTDTEGNKKLYLFLNVEKLENFKDSHRGAEYVPN